MRGINSEAIRYDMSGKTVIQTVELTKVYRIGVLRCSVETVTGPNLNVFAGEAFAFLGLNGAGKTTTIKLLKIL